MKLSVIMTTSGRWPLLGDALASVERQGVEGIELLVVCDAYSKRAEEYFDFFAKNNSEAKPLIYLGHEDKHTKRVAAMINLGLDAATGEFVAYLCDDDVMLPGHLTKMLELVEAGADWVVDRVQWLSLDGRRSRHEALGNFVYPKPFEKRHAELARSISATGVNWICHDCSMHRRGAERWDFDDDPKKAPVDWRFWCKLFDSGLRPVVISHVGVEAFVPGTWRRGNVTMQAAVAARSGGLTMGERVIKYAVNVGVDGERPKTEVFERGGRTVEVGPYGKVDALLVTTPTGQLFPAFVMEGVLKAPRLKTLDAEQPVKLVTNEIGATAAPKVQDPLITKAGPEKQKTAFKLVPGTSAKKKSKDELEGLFKSELMDMANKLNLKLSAKAKKADIIQSILASG